MQTTIWIAYNADNDCVVSFDDHDTALQDLMDNYGPCGGTRVVEMKVTLPDVKPTVVEAVIPDTDGPVTGAPIISASRNRLSVQHKGRNRG